MIKSIWKKVISIGLIASAVAVVPIVATSNIISNNIIQSPKEEKYYLIDNSVYNTQQEAIDSIKNQADIVSDVIGIDNSYFLSSIANDQKDKFSNSSEYKDFLGKYIQNINAKSSLTYDQIEQQLDPNDNSLPLNVLKRLAIDGTNNNEIKIYRGYNGEIFLNEEDAKMSYYRVYDGYQYNNIYFRSREELKYYLKTVFFKDASSIPGIKDKYILKLFNSESELLSSIPLDMNLNDLDSIKQNKDLNKYLDATVQNEITYQYEDNGNKNNLILRTKKDINNAIQDPVIKESLLKDLSYFKMYDTNSKAGFIVDTLAEDDAEFIGENYVETNQDIKGIADWRNWNSVNNDINQRYQSALNNSLSSMFNYFALEMPYKSFGNHQEMINNAAWFNYSEISSTNSQEINGDNKRESISLNDWFKNRMLSFGADGNNLYYDILNNAIKLEATKNFNSFLKIPTLYSMVMNIIYDRELPYGITNTVQTYFNEVAKFLDKKILNLIPGGILQSLNGKDFFSFVTFFNLENNNNNFNQNIKNVYLDKLKTDFPFLAIFALIQNSAKVNQQTTLGSWKFDYSHYMGLVEDYINKNPGLNSDNDLIRDRARNLTEEFTYTWDLFSVPTGDELYELFDNYKNSSIWDLNSKYIISVLDDSYYGTHLDDFLTYNVPEKQIINSNTLLYYKDFNTRTKLADFFTFARYLKNNPIFQSFLPSGVSKTMIDNAITQSDAIMDTFTRNSKKSYDAKQIINLVSIYKETISFSTEVRSGFEAGVKRIYDLGDRLSIFTNQSLQKLEILNLTERNLIIQIQTSIEVTGEKYLGDVVLDKVEKISNGISSIVGTLNVFQKIITGKYNNSHQSPAVIANIILRDIIDTGILKIFGPWGEVAHIVASIFVPTVRELAYSFELNNSEKWYRVGGTEHSMLFGLIKWQNNSIKDMKIDNPIPIYKNRSEENYYYNSKKYTDLDKLLYDQLQDIMNGKIINKHFNKKFYHYMECNVNPSNNSPSIVAFDTVNAAKDYIYETLFKNGGLLIQNIVKDYNGSIVGGSNNEAIEYAIDKITSTGALRSTKFINLPYIKNGSVDFSYNQEIPVFQFPISWDQANNMIINSTNKNSLIINNPIYESKNNQVPIFKNYEYTNAEMKNQFLSSFNVQIKTTLQSEITYNNDFDKIINSINYASLYKVNVPSMQTKYFISYDDAMSYLEKVFNLKVVSNELIRTSYFYNKIQFNNMKELENYVLNNLKPMTKKELEEYLQNIEQEVNYV